MNDDNKNSKPGFRPRKDHFHNKNRFRKHNEGVNHAPQPKKTSSAPIETIKATDEVDLIEAADLHEQNKDLENSNINENGGELQEEQVLRFVRVRFPGHNKSYPFCIGKRKFPYGHKVVAMSDRGLAVGYVNSFPYDVKYHKDLGPIRYINKLATEQDIAFQEEHYHKEKSAEREAEKIIHDLKLDMEVTHVEYIQYGKKAVFYFVSPGRVDFRELVKHLIQRLKIKIELRQITVRDRVAALGGLGACGLQTCCSSFLSKYGQVNIKMAKNQNFTLLDQRLNGVCGQLKCCLAYENEVYTEKLKLLPKKGDLIKALNGDLGRVDRIHTLAEQFEMLTDEGKIKRYSSTQYDPNQSNPPTGWSFPERFDSIVNETDQLVS